MSTPCEVRLARKRSLATSFDDAFCDRAQASYLIQADAHREAAIEGLQRVSKPGLRVYAKSTNLPKVRGGLGVAILSTSSGLLTDRQAAEKGVGGEVLAYIW